METTSAQTRRSGSFDSDGLAASARDDKREAADGVRNDGRCRTASAQDDTCAPAVAFEHVTKRFGDAVAVNDVDLAIEEGAFVAIIGSSGCGKTTLLKMVNALVMPDEGEVLVHGQATSSVDPIELRRTVGYAIQGSVLFPHLSVEQNIAYVPTLLNKRDRRRTEAAVEKWMDIIGLPRDIMDRYPAELSGGQAQRVGIARALAASPDILLMDEPFSAVDAITRSSLQDELKRIHERTGITVLFVTHDIDEAFYLGDRVLVMEAGRAVQYASPHDILSAPAVPFVDKLVAKRRAAYLS